MEGIHRLYFGHAALLGDNEIEALLEYGNTLTDESLGRALFDMEQMAAYLPDQRTRLLNFLYRLRNARLLTRQQMDSTSVDFYWAYYKIPVFGAQQQWDSALYWSATASDLAEKIFNRLPTDRSAQNNWLDALLYQSYYLLFASMRDPANLSRAIRVSQEAQLYFERADNFSFYKHKALIQINLAHAYWLRQQTGDREPAVQIYQSFLTSPFETYDPWEMVLKDFRDLRKAGLQWPCLGELIEEIKPPGVELEASDWEDLGIEAPGG